MKLDKSTYYPESPFEDSDVSPDIDASPAPGINFSPVASDDSPVSTGNSVTESPDESAISGNSGTPESEPSPAESAVSAVAHILSWVFVPLLMPVYAAILAFNYSVLSFTGVATRWMFALIIFIVNVAIPSVLVLILKKVGVVQDVGLNNRQERFFPYVICIIALIGTALFLSFKGAPQWLVMFYMGGAAAGIIEVIINRWWKISVHAAGIAGIVALLTYLLLREFSMPGIQGWLIASIAIAGLLGSARVWLGRHTVWQVLAGYAVGFCVVYLMMLTAPATPILNF